MSAHDSKTPKNHHHQADAASSDLPFAPTLRKAIIIMVFGFATPVIILLLIAHFIAGETVPAPGSPALSPSATEQRIEPVAQASVAASQAAPAASAAAAASTTAAASAAPAAAPAAKAAAAAPTVADAGKKLYDATCSACHGTGVAGAPKVGDKAAWAPLVAQGSSTLYDHAIHGFTGKTGMMPPKGGSQASDADVKAAVDYMVAQSK